MKKQLSTHAQAAKLMRQELKQAFPTIEFSVRSQSYAGGNSIHVEWQDGPKTKDVQKITGKYEYGHFDGMQDCYEYSNVREDIPQVKYVQDRREVSETIKDQVFEYLKRTHAYFDTVSSRDESSSILLDRWNVWTASEYIYRITCKMDLTQGLNLNEIN